MNRAGRTARKAVDRGFTVFLGLLIGLVVYIVVGSTLGALFGFDLGVEALQDLLSGVVDDLPSDPGDRSP